MQPRALTITVFLHWLSFGLGAAPLKLVVDSTGGLPDAGEPELWGAQLCATNRGFPKCPSVRT